jgi:GT2 family glycosyltransferase
MVHILIPAYNNKKEVLTLLNCLSQQSYRSFRIILVDDGSTDGTKEEVSALFPHTVILVGDGNLWWTGANCLGVDYILKEAADNDFILLLNNDLMVESGYLAGLVEASNRFNRALVGSTLVDYRNHAFMESGIKIDNYLQLTVNRNREQITSTDFDLEVDVLSGRGTLIPVEVFREIGSFKKRALPHYGADYEFSIRAKRTGYKLHVSHKAIVYAKLDITGLEAPEDGTIPTLKDSLALLFSKKSKSNLRYFMTYSWLCSEKGFKLRNTVMGGVYIINYIFLNTAPLIQVRRRYRICTTLFKKPLLFIFRFLFMSYGLEASDIERQGLGLKDLLDANIITEFESRGKKLYLFRPGTQKYLMNFSNHEKLELLKLNKFSRSFSYKVSVIELKLKTFLCRSKLNEA